jgi:hypothetical protein
VQELGLEAQVRMSTGEAKGRDFGQELAGAGVAGALSPARVSGSHGDLARRMLVR